MSLPVVSPWKITFVAKEEINTERTSDSFVLLMAEAELWQSFPLLQVVKAGWIVRVFSSTVHFWSCGSLPGLGAGRAVMFSEQPVCLELPRLAWPDLSGPVFWPLVSALVKLFLMISPTLELQPWGQPSAKHPDLPLPWVSELCFTPPWARQSSCLVDAPPQKRSGWGRRLF